MQLRLIVKESAGVVTAAVSGKVAVLPSDHVMSCDAAHKGISASIPLYAVEARRPQPCEPPRFARDH